MSIYASWLHLHAHDEHEDTCARWVEATEDEARQRGRYMISDGPRDTDRFSVYEEERSCTCGNEGPIVYQGSHVNPRADDLRGGSLEVGVIPNHCHPDVRGAASDEGPPVEFLRVSMTEHPDTYHGLEPGSATLVLERGQVERLRDTLTSWLEADERW